MDCREYIEQYLSAQADGELSEAEERLAREHLDGCPGCRARLADEQALKLMVRRAAAGSRAPAAVSARVRAALEAEAGRGARGGVRDLAAARRAMREPHRRPVSLSRNPVRIIAPLAVAAIVVIVLLLARGRGIEPGLTPESGMEVSAAGVFGNAIARYASFERDFASNVPSTSLAQLAGAYRAAGMPDTLWDFSGTNFQLVGGRLEHRADGRIATYTLYRSGDQTIMCSFLSHAKVNRAPVAAATIGPLRFFRYRGYSICLNQVPGTDCLCVLVSRQPLPRLIHEVIVSKS